MFTYTNTPPKLAFSLIELSIVLVIMGLMVGGILAGKSLIKAAELNSIVTEFQRYHVAVLSFKSKYFQLPGDMNNAVRFWGAQAGGTADGKDSTCAALTTAATSSTTCNGDGDGVIDYDNTFGSSQDDSTYESWRAWQHLANANLIEGKYSGVAPAGAFGADYLPGINSPKARYGNQASWAIWIAPTIRDWVPDSGKHYIVLGTPLGAYTGRWHNEVLTPQEQWNIDMKIDDGKPYAGKLVDMANSVVVGFNYTTSCTTSETFATATYDFSYPNVACVPMFKSSF